MTRTASTTTREALSTTRLAPGYARPTLARQASAVPSTGDRGVMSPLSPWRRRRYFIPTWATAASIRDPSLRADAARRQALSTRCTSRQRRMRSSRSTYRESTTYFEPRYSISKRPRTKPSPVRRGRSTGELRRKVRVLSAGSGYTDFRSQHFQTRLPIEAPSRPDSLATLPLQVANPIRSYRTEVLVSRNFEQHILGTCLDQGPGERAALHLAAGDVSRSPPRYTSPPIRGSRRRRGVRAS